MKQIFQVSTAFCVSIATIFFATSCLKSSSVNPPPVKKPTRVDNPSVKPLAKGNTAFAVDLYRELGNAEKGNLLFSPYSVSSALGMTYAGARGNTEAEMKQALHFPLKQEELPAAFKSLNRTLADVAQASGHKLNIANGLCITGPDVGKEFKSLLEDKYEAELFRGGLAEINGWVKKKTEGKIEKILTQLDPNSVCVLLNAIYFKGTWASQFKETSTHDAPFNMAGGKSVKVPLMYQKGDFRLLDEKDFQAISVPYKGKQVSMVMFLPRKVDGLASLEKNLTTQTLAKWLAALDKQHEREVELFMPKYKLETKYDLVSYCKKLGMKDAFELSTADFSGMGWPKGKLCIAQIKHKAFVEVNEEGTEAAAATAVEMKNEMAVMYPTFRADHPFLFVIRDNLTGSIVFMGRLADPQSK